MSLNVAVQSMHTKHEPIYCSRMDEIRAGMASQQDTSPATSDYESSDPEDGQESLACPVFKSPPSQTPSFFQHKNSSLPAIRKEGGVYAS